MRELFVSEPGLGAVTCKPGAGDESLLVSPGGHTPQCHEPRDEKIHGASPDTGTGGERERVLVSVCFA